MDIMTSRPLILLRKVVRTMNIRPRKLKGAQREEVFRSRLFESVRPGDVVWDVGAAWGGVTHLLSGLVGSTGVVVAFEPSEGFLEKLRKLAEQHSNVSVQPRALGNLQGTVRSSSDGHNLHVATATSDQIIEITSGDLAVAEDGVPAPNIIKIDVEGLELDVLQGCSRLLADPSLRGVFIEVHFRILDESGRPQVPGQIVALLRQAGFRTSWADPSHLVAVRQ